MYFLDPPRGLGTKAEARVELPRARARGPAGEPGPLGFLSSGVPGKALGSL